MKLEEIVKLCGGGWVMGTAFLEMRQPLGLEVNRGWTSNTVRRRALLCSS